MQVYEEAARYRQMVAAYERIGALPVDDVLDPARLAGMLAVQAYFHLGPVDRWWEDLDSYRFSVLGKVRLGLDRMEAPMRAAIQVLRRA